MVRSKDKSENTKGGNSIMKKLLSIVICIVVGILFIVPAYAESDTLVTFSDSSVSVSGSSTGLSISGTDVKITKSGTYTFAGSCSDGTIVVKKGVTGVTIILNDLTLSAHATAPISCNKSTQVTIFAAAGSANTLSDDKYNNDDTYTDSTAYPDIENAVIKCKDGSNVTICGTGAINVNAYGKNGIKGGYDLYEEDDSGNATDTLLSTSSLTIKDVTLNINAYVNDALKSDKELNILSGNVTISSVDDGIKSDYILNIGAEGTTGPTIKVTKSAEGIEGATINVWSGNITVNATDDGINAANSDLSNYDFSYNQYGGYVYVNVTNGDGIDSNGKINLKSGTLEVYSPSQGDGDPIDSDKGASFAGATVLAVGNYSMPQSYTATTPYVTFGNASGGGPGGKPGGFGGGNQTIVSAGSTIEIKDASGNTLYCATALRNAGNVLFSSPELTSGSSYSLYVNGSQVATASAGTNSSGANQPGQPGGMFSVLQYIYSLFVRIVNFVKSIFGL